ncbi:MAG: DUF885 domain-containing protein [Myxococcales bacterium]|nr:DUF885 domain-containing protein [Myxococcales bacterium]
MTRRAALVALLAVACAGRPPGAGPRDAVALPRTFTSVAADVLDHQLREHPQRGVELGLHAYDGKLPDVSAAGLERARRQVAADLAALGAVDRAGLDRRARVEHAALIGAVLADRFELEVRRAPWRDPMAYLGPLDLTAYISRDYAPLEERAAAVAAIAEGSAAYLEHARARLERALPRTFLDTALLQTRGSAQFVRVDVPAALAGVGDPALRRRLQAGLASMAAALDGYAQHLDDLRAHATQDFALGPDAFAQMLRETQGIDVPLPRLMALVQADLDRNVGALTAAAAQIEPAASVADVIAGLGHVPAAEVLAVATAQSRRTRDFVVARDLVSIPNDDVVRVVDTPPFLRWNAAFLNPSGPFEDAGLPSFYYISPPDPTWPAAQQREFVPSAPELLFITVHEVWPGHFVHGQHLRTNPSRALKATWNYTTAEGWAHYVEQMMFDAGLDDDPRVHVGQLLNALLRDVRALSAIGLHTQGWDVERARHLFRTAAFQDEANAAQQAVRGTFDPMYLAYTVGKLVILQLRADVEARQRARGEPFSLRAFHDELLSYGAAPLGAIRQAMLDEPDDARTPLL